MDKNQKVILITGASSGFGKTCAEYLSSKGHRVYGTSRKLVTETKPYEMIQMDVNSDSSVKQGIKHIVTKEGHLNVVINNAGFGIAGALEDTSIEDARFQFETNFFGVLRVCHEVLPIMRKEKHGYIINIGSITGSIGAPFHGAYSASKSALQRFTEVLRMEIKPSGIHALLIEPGDFNTGITDRRIYTKLSQTNPEYKERCNRAVQTMEKDERNGNDPKSFALLVDKIINTPSPRLKYTIGPRLELFAVHLKKFIPSKLFERIIMKTYKI